MKYCPREEAPNHSWGHGDIWLREEGQGEGHYGHEVGYSIGGGLKVCHATLGL